MALAERGILRLPRTFPRTESGTKSAETKPTLYSEKEISAMMFPSEAPNQLSRENPVETPVGTWSMDGDITIFESKTEAEIAKITKVSAKRKLVQLAIKILNMS